MKKYVLTGSPSCGKSSVIIALEMLGEHVVHEAATDVIRYKQAQGIEKPWEEADFQEDHYKLQQRREARIPQGIDRVFIDRGIADGLAYIAEGHELAHKVRGHAQEHRYEQIFLIEPLERTETNRVRREDRKEALSIGDKLLRIYKDLGYKPVIIGQGTVEERAKQILKAVKPKKTREQDYTPPFGWAWDMMGGHN